MHHHKRFWRKILVLGLSMIIIVCTAEDFLKGDSNLKWLPVAQRRQVSSFVLKPRITDLRYVMSRRPDVIVPSKNSAMKWKFNIHLNVSKSAYETSMTFLSLCIASSIFRNTTEWIHFNTGSQKLQNLAAALSPANLRLGGTAADFLTFDPYSKKDDSASSPDITDKDDFFMLDAGLLWDAGFSKLHDSTNYTMTGKQWDSITTFAQKVGWDLMFDFNLFKWHRWQEGLWDPSNAELLLKYSAERNVSIPAFQLGNEPNFYKRNFNFSIPGDTLVKDFAELKRLTSEFDLYKNSKIYGPDVTGLHSYSSRLLLLEFLKDGGNKVVDAASWHHYYLDGRTATVEQFMDPKVLDGMKTELQTALNLTGQSPPVLPLRLTETSSCYGGGAPGISDRFVAGFMWLDKLGLCAQAGVTAVFRQTFYRGNYALLSVDLDPNPDYYLSLLYKRLILGPVLNATFEPSISHLRVYAHCVRRDFYNYPQGAVVLYYLNLRDSNVTLTLDQFEGQSLDLFLLSPGDGAGPLSKLVKLNGQTLTMQGPELPPLNPSPHKGDISVSAQSFGFIVVPNAQVKVCS
ncbi:heparanase isoform X2 [Aplysia californica]|uniref:Heparanase isoform X2 n=1 Tax=Aplysia californica TaxID=6500 RepID=A0ABM1A8E4_APLCA|nr:heparanase isoform X2 [Aplysia californica]